MKLNNLLTFIELKLWSKRTEATALDKENGYEVNIGKNKNLNDLFNFEYILKESHVY